jgi:hypothetical protein
MNIGQSCVKLPLLVLYLGSPTPVFKTIEKYGSIHRYLFSEKITCRMKSYPNSQLLSQQSLQSGVKNIPQVACTIPTKLISLTESWGSIEMEVGWVRTL